VVWGFGGIAQWVIANAARLQGLYMHAADLLEQRGLYAAELFAEQINVLWLVRILRAVGGSLQDVLNFSIVTFVFVILGLLEVEPLGRRLRPDRLLTNQDWLGLSRAPEMTADIEGGFDDGIAGEAAGPVRNR
jgi:hypothetical protein